MKVAIFLFRNDPMITMHVFLYLKELNERGEGKLILEGQATALPRTAEGKVRELYEMVKEKGWIDCVCKACSMATDSLDYNEKEGLRICSELEGHPSMAKYLEKGYTVLAF